MHFKKLQRFEPFGKTLLVLAGVILTRLFQNDPLALAPIPFIVAILVGVVLVLKLLGIERLAKALAGLIARGGPWVADLGADFSVGAGFGILLAVGLNNWGAWVLFAVFFALALEMIWLGDLVKTIKQRSR